MRSADGVMAKRTYTGPAGTRRERACVRTGRAQAISDQDACPSGRGGRTETQVYGRIGWLGETGGDIGCRVIIALETYAEVEECRLRGGQLWRRGCLSKI